jgi:hypothetical protein
VNVGQLGLEVQIMKSRAARAFHISLISGKLDELEQYHGRIEEFIDHEVARLHALFAEGLDEPTEEERYERTDFYSDEHTLLSEVFTRTLRASVLVATYTLFETSLDALCAADQKRQGHTLVLRDLAGQGVERAKLYLIKVCRVAFPADSHDWARLMDLNKIRNAFAHADGDVRRLRDPERLREVIRRTPGLRLRNDTYLEIDRAYVASIIRDVRSFFDLLHKAFPD